MQQPKAFVFVRFSALHRSIVFRQLMFNKLAKRDHTVHLYWIQFDNRDHVKMILIPHLKNTSFLIVFPDCFGKINLVGWTVGEIWAPSVGFCIWIVFRKCCYCWRQLSMKNVWEFSVVCPRYVHMYVLVHVYVQTFVCNTEFP